MQLTGGVGRKALTQFYRNHFIFNNPEDTALELVSRTVGVDRVIDEFVFSFTHDKVIDWLYVSLSSHHCPYQINPP
jgi:carboxymethylenebutenolidase